MENVFCPAVEVAAALAAGWQQVAPHDDLHRIQLSAGAGVLSALHDGLGGQFIPLPVRDPWGQVELGTLLLTEDATGAKTAFILVPGVADLVESGPGNDHPTSAGSAPCRTPGDLIEQASSYGVGQLLLAARESGAKKIVLAIDSARSHDGGAGVLAALGLPSPQLSRGIAGLAELQPRDLRGLTELRADWAEVDLLVASTSELALLGLAGASATEARSRGASAAQAQSFESVLGRFSHLAQGSLAPGAPLLGRGVAGLPGSGAGGGIGFAARLLGARHSTLAAMLATALDLPRRVSAAEVVLATCAELDWRALHSGPIAELGRAGERCGVPVVVLSGSQAVGRRELLAAGIAAAYPLRSVSLGAISSDSGSTANRDASEDPAVSAHLRPWTDLTAQLQARAGRVARTWSPGR